MRYFDQSSGLQSGSVICSRWFNHAKVRECPHGNRARRHRGYSKTKLTPLFSAITFHGMFGVSHVFVGVDAAGNLFKSGERILGAIWQVRVQRRRSRRDFLRRAARQLRRLTRFLFKDNLADVFLHCIGCVGVGGGLLFRRERRSRGGTRVAVFQMIAIYRRVPLHFDRRLFRVRVVMGRHDDTDYDWKICGREGERKRRKKIKQNTKFGVDSARICPRESRGLPER